MPNRCLSGATNLIVLWREIFNPHTPVAQKVGDEVFFRRFKGEGVEFFTTTMFIHTKQPLITSFYIKKLPIFCRISDDSALIRNFLRNGRVKG